MRPAIAKGCATLVQTIGRVDDRSRVRELVDDCKRRAIDENVRWLECSKWHIRRFSSDIYDGFQVTYTTVFNFIANELFFFLQCAAESSAHTYTWKSGRAFVLVYRPQHIFFLSLTPASPIVKPFTSWPTSRLGGCVVDTYGYRSQKPS